MGEDTELAHKLREHNYKIILDPQCIVYNKGFPKNILEFIKSEIWHGDSFKSVFFHKKIDILTIYFVLSFFSIILFLFSMVGIVNRINAVLPVILIFIPAIIKAFKKRKSFDLRFFQLLVIYTVYIVSRSLSIFKW